MSQKPVTLKPFTCLRCGNVCLKPFRCLRCGNVWYPDMRKLMADPNYQPKRCPASHCKSPDWFRPRRMKKT